MYEYDTYDSYKHFGSPFDSKSLMVCTCGGPPGRLCCFLVRVLLFPVSVETYLKYRRPDGALWQRFMLSRWTDWVGESCGEKFYRQEFENNFDLRTGYLRNTEMVYCKCKSASSWSSVTERSIFPGLFGGTSLPLIYKFSGRRPGIVP